ncbi:MAG TPA: orotidine-5'-phosphate decarboxylase [Acidimicrobiia bacterium]|nr:orotidine-5'-phosphate decarboxylase [Acidimicrobiia bacterium]
MPVTDPAAPPEIRDRLAIALDVDDLDDAVALARRVAPWFGIAKVGLELYTVAGPVAFARMHELGLRVFADLKLHDIPTTVERASRAAARHGVEFLNMHAAGGVAMLRAGIEGARAGARDHAPAMLAVTVLTSDADTSAFSSRLDATIAAGCDGVVCSAHEVHTVKERDASLRAMVPGVRLEGDARDDQARVATPADVVAAGGDWLVLGRAVTRAARPEHAAATVVASLHDGLKTASHLR